MTLLDQLRILRIPAFVKFVLAILALALIMLNVYVIYRGLQDQRYDFWIAAGASLLAAVTPALAVLSVLVVTESGMGALKRRMQQILAKDLPNELRFTFEAPSPRLDADCKPHKLRFRPNVASVECGMYREELWANYKLSARTSLGIEQIALMRVELVMRRVNINLLFEKAAAAKRFSVSPAASLEAFASAFRETFKHTIDGAERAGYTFNHLALQRQTGNSNVIAFVATRAIEAEFVWDPAARLEFIQDLVLMMRSFVSESPDVFIPENAA
jgi:hypothetical protein